MSTLPSDVSLLAGITASLRKAGCVFAEEEAAILAASARSAGELRAMAARRADGAPLEHVVGWAEFAGLRIAVAPGVFVPRRRTEFLVAEAARLLPEHAVVVDLCCGSGALGAALHAAGKGVELHAADIDPAAVACARGNVRGTVHQGDLFEPLPARLRGRVDVLLANVPYVPSDQIALLPSEARDHEARTALDGGPDGLDVLRRVAAAAPRWLAPRGRLLVETGEHQTSAAVAAFTAHGLTVHVASAPDYDATVLIATLPRPHPAHAEEA
ncbi:release factor glutamine methyltransferase [Actinocorallia herbida]|uniref:peptide chain release factor N(5)-glutamine methyltransferase n=1 Tax=Actinocorallia herbida TaxID=58109 RepID=A0A3N1DBX6_9ACTN|nr:putative protein N(5)-glutamine methyltransferase [Actinocorallia herbida]ROO91025.1 release factor glutamine methyltransferase [Actinocorallia herbida]